MNKPFAVGPWIGGVTSTTSVVKILVSSGVTATLALTEKGGDSRPPLHPQAIHVHPSVVFYAFYLDNLRADAEYSLAITTGGATTETLTGEFRTFPREGIASSFTFVCGGDAVTGSTDEVFVTMRNERPLFFCHLGDLHYSDPGATVEDKEPDANNYLAAYYEVLKSSTQAALYSSVPIAYVWDDHDYSGNNETSTAKSKLLARRMYQEAIPHYPLAFSASYPGDLEDIPICQAFTVGRVRFIMTDSRSECTPDTLLGQRQKQWLINELLASKNEGGFKYPLVVWVNTLPWIGKKLTWIEEVLAKAGKGSGEAPWAEYEEERREIGEIILQNGLTNVCMLSADAHMLAIDDGSCNKPPHGFGSFPIFHASPLDKRKSKKGGPYSHGMVANKKGQYGRVVINDDGDRITVTWTGIRDGKAVQGMTHTFVSPRNA